MKKPEMTPDSVFVQIILCAFLIISLIAVRNIEKDRAYPAGSFGESEKTSSHTFSDLAKTLENRFESI